MTQVPTQFPRFPRKLTLLVGGHRADRLGADAAGGANALARLDQVLARFAQLAGAPQVHDADALFGKQLYEPGPCHLRLLTGSADGVDAHAAASAARLNIPLQLVAAADSIGGVDTVTFGCPADILASDDEAYGLRDEFALSHADVLVVIWDGEVSRGRAGGTVRLIRQAAHSGTPVLWIDMDGALRELDVAAIDTAALFQLAHGVFDRRSALSLFSAPIDDPLTPTLQAWLDPLHARTQDSLPLQALRHYAEQKSHAHWYEKRASLLDRLLCAVATLDGPAFIKAWSSDATSSWLETTPGFPLSATLSQRFAWSDVRANIAAGRHRGGIWLLYLFSSLAVFAAVAGVLHGGGHHGWQALVWPCAEAVILLAILVMVKRAQSGRWHGNWLGHRFMAEQLRYLAVTRPFLGATSVFRQPLLARHPATGKLVLRNAEAWLLRRTLLDEGVQIAGPAYNLQQVDAAPLAAGLRAMVDGSSGQLRYHHAKASSLHRMHTAMHRLARVLFGLSLLAVILHFVLPPLGLSEIEWLLYFTAFCPALAASLHGIQTKLEFSRVAALSHEVAAELKALIQALETRSTSLEPDSWRSRLYLRQIALQAAHVMSEESGSWRNLIAQQDAELPA